MFPPTPHLEHVDVPLQPVAGSDCLEKACWQGPAWRLPGGGDLPLPNGALPHFPGRQSAGLPPGHTQTSHHQPMQTGSRRSCYCTLSAIMCIVHRAQCKVHSSQCTVHVQGTECALRRRNQFPGFLWSPGAEKRFTWPWREASYCCLLYSVTCYTYRFGLLAPRVDASKSKEIMAPRLENEEIALFFASFLSLGLFSILLALRFQKDLNHCVPNRHACLQHCRKMLHQIV